MNKARFLFALVAAVAVVGAVSATKAQASDTIYIADAVHTICTIPTHATLLNQGQAAIGIFYAADRPGPCNLQTIYQPL